MTTILAALRDAAGGPQIPEIHDVAPPLEVPWPLWLKILLVAAAAIALGLAVWGVVRLAKRRPRVPPPSPRAIALRELEELRAQLSTLDPYAFSIVVSDVLRR